MMDQIEINTESTVIKIPAIEMGNKAATYAITATISSVIIVGVVIVFAFRENKHPPMSPLEGVYNAVSQELYDPESAEFRNVIMVHDTYCGEVNSKDKSGEYVGFKNFMVRKTESKKFGLVVSFLNEHIEIFCR
jgi:hypothetical protein